MTTVQPPADPGRDRAEVSEAPTYQGSRFPWWLTLLWLAFAAFAVIYSMLYYLPDLKAWLAA